MSDTDQFDDQGILARTLWGEARNQGITGMTAIACVVLNRVNSGITWWGTNVRDACLKPFQFSCWLKSDPNRALLIGVTEDDYQFAKAIDISANAMLGGFPDITNAATSYYVKTMPHPPKWAEGKEPCAEIGSHVFYKDV